MSTHLAATVYWSGMLVLFFFWAYGVASFVFDMKNKIIPGLVKYRRGRRAEKAEQQREDEREEREKQLY
ncbi:hypothetical protein [Haloarcula nitratireducens]|uniref:Uncharacterized protein n=1 Tax=Haloarcula nitratireducens TaxID=2487749 RepID=A0AAW4P887_9EURY|nr:hypothetical protein [Halomicroarcula nitratireducens]MBX0294137.1 hypothetical protein [Halomicroarcula nitratireducens]